MTQFAAPSVPVFTRANELAATRAGTYSLLRCIQAFPHEAVCNAIIDLDEEDVNLVSSAVRYLTVTAAVDASNDRRPAITAIAGK